MIRTHPVTGRQAIFVNPVFTHSIKDLPEGESKAILDFLYEHCAARPLAGAVPLAAGFRGLLGQSLRAAHRHVGLLPARAPASASPSREIVRSDTVSGGTAEGRRGWHLVGSPTSLPFIWDHPGGT